MIKSMVFSVVLVSSSFAHTAIMSCFDNGDNTITCEGGFSDGSSASGVTFRLMQRGGKVIFENRFSEDSDITFDKPNMEFAAVFDAGEGHEVHVFGEDIVE